MPTITVDENGAGQRLDRYLRKVLYQMPTGHIYKLLRTRKVRINGKRARSEQLLELGDEVLIHMDIDQFRADTKRTKKKSLVWDFRVIFEDQHLLAISKPPNLAVHPGAGHLGNSLIDQIHTYLEVSDKPTAFRPSLAHRLDKDTSGILIVGKTLEALQKLSRMFRDGKVVKKYLALARGIPEPRKGLWEMAVKRKDISPNSKNKKTKKETVGKTAYRVGIIRKISHNRNEKTTVSLLVLQLLTGRTHQIRSHLQQMNHPLAGDPRYGDRDFNNMLRKTYNLRRQFLHAYRMELIHPITNKPLKWVDPYPDDLLPIVQDLRLGVP
jgi:23S rRNA pseudouridine955/2504/2580 synthase